MATNPAGARIEAQAAMVGKLCKNCSIDENLNLRCESRVLELIVLEQVLICNGGSEGRHIYTQVDETDGKVMKKEQGRVLDRCAACAVESRKERCVRRSGSLHWRSSIAGG